MEDLYQSSSDVFLEAHLLSDQELIQEFLKSMIILETMPSDFANKNPRTKKLLYYMYRGLMKCMTEFI